MLGYSVKRVMPLSSIVGITTSSINKFFVLHIKNEKSNLYEYKKKDILIKDLMIALFNKTGEKIKVW